jgi:hypothetical protein
MTNRPNSTTICVQKRKPQWHGSHAESTWPLAPINPSSLDLDTLRSAVRHSGARRFQTRLDDYRKFSVTSQDRSLEESLLAGRKNGKN